MATRKWSSAPLEGRGIGALSYTADVSVGPESTHTVHKLLESPHPEAHMMVPDPAEGLPLVASATTGGSSPQFTKPGFSIWSSGWACVHVAALIFSLGALAVKLTAERIPAFEMVFVRSSLCVAATLPVAIAQDVSPISGHMRNWPLLALRGLVGTTAMTAMYFAVDSLPLQDAVTLFFTNPAVTALLAWAVLGEQLGWLAATGCGLSLGGVLLVTRPPFIFGGGEVYGTQQIFGIVMGVVSALFGGMAFVCIRAIGKKEPAIVMTLWFHSVALLSTLCPLLTGWPAPFVVPSPGDALLMVGVAVASFFGQLLLSRGVQLEQAAKASSINLMQVLYSYIYSLAVFGNRITLLGALGSVMVTSGVLVINLRACCGGRTPKGTSSDEEQQAILTQPLLMQPDKHVACAADSFPTANPPIIPGAQTLFGSLDCPCALLACGTDGAPGWLASELDCEPESRLERTEKNGKVPAVCNGSDGVVAEWQNVDCERGAAGDGVPGTSGRF